WRSGSATRKRFTAASSISSRTASKPKWWQRPGPRDTVSISRRQKRPAMNGTTAAKAGRRFPGKTGGGKQRLLLFRKRKPQKSFKLRREKKNRGRRRFSAGIWACFHREFSGFSIPTSFLRRRTGW